MQKVFFFFFSYFLGRSVGVLEEEAEWNRGLDVKQKCREL